MLKRLPSQPDSFSVFDRHSGKIVCVVKDFDLAAGSLISYFVPSRGARRFVKNVKILDVPLSVARSDIFLLHHVLELCHYFLPACNISTETFDLVMHLYTSAKKLTTLLTKKIFLFKLLVSFGFYSDHAPFSLTTFSRISSESIDSLVSSSLHLEIERNIDKWLLLCVGAHPQFANFKTVQFLKKIGCYETI